MTWLTWIHRTSEAKGHILFGFGIIDIPPWRCQWEKVSSHSNLKSSKTRFCFAMITILFLKESIPNFESFALGKKVIILTLVFSTVMGCSQSGAKQAMARDSRDVEIVDVGMLSRELLQKYLDMFGSSCCIWSGQIIATSHDLTSKGSWRREIPLFHLISGKSRLVKYYNLARYDWMGGVSLVPPLGDWMILNATKWMSESDVGLFVTVTPLVFHRTVLFLQQSAGSVENGNLRDDHLLYKRVIPLSLMIGEDSDGSSTLGSPKVDDLTCGRMCQRNGTTTRHWGEIQKCEHPFSSSPFK